MKIEDLVQLYPYVYHMAERDTWDSICDFGLLSTTAVLDKFEVSPSERHIFEENQRKNKIEISSSSNGSIVLRDQKPMPRERLLQALKKEVTPEDWYRLINQKVFFWAEEHRLQTLLNARDYRHLEHDVLVISSEKFFRDYADKIWLCHMNSGNTWPMPHAREVETFKRIEDYPVKASGKPIKVVVEITVDYSVPNISEYVVEVRRMKGSEILYYIKG